MATQITREFDEPYYGGDSANGTISSVASIGGSLVALNGRIYPIDTASNRYAQRGIDVVQQRNTTDTRDVLLLPQNVWRQQVWSWHSGAGQSNMDRDDSIQTRYDNSFGVDVFEKWRMSLLPATEQLQSLANSNSTFLTLHNGYLVVVNGNTTYWWEDFDTMSASVTLGANTIIDIADRGATVLGLNSSGYIYELDGPRGS